VIQSKSGSTFSLKLLGKTTSISTGSITIEESKNPPYDEEAYDMWGMYKSDANTADLAVDEKLGRYVTDVSAKGIDAWSLRSVKTVTGAKISFEFESDSYNKPVLYQSYGLVVEDMKKINATTTRIPLLTAFSDISRVVRPGTQMDYQILFTELYTKWDHCVGSPQPIAYGYTVKMKNDKIIVKDIVKESGKWVIYTDTDLSYFFNSKPTLFETAECSEYYWKENGYETTYESFFIAANLSVSGNLENLGGGIRTKSVTVNSYDKSSTTNFTYNNPEITDQNYTSGRTSYEPGGIDQARFFYPNYPSHFTASNKESLEKQYKKSFYKNFEKILQNSREVPAPGVLYNYVTVSGYTTKEGVNYPIENTVRYEFEPLESTDVQLTYSNNESSTFPQKTYEGYIKYSKKESRNVTIRDFTAQVGSLKSITLFDKNGSKISETINHYLNNDGSFESKLDADFKNQGVIEESFSDARFASRPNTDFTLQGIISKREQFPLVPLGQTTTNFITGVQTKTTTKAFDYYSGQPTKTISIDGFGNTYLTEIIPAYRKYTGMGQLAAGGDNMLTQQAGVYTYEVDPSNNYTPIALVSANVSTWSDAIPSLKTSRYNTAATQPGIWRQTDTYLFTGDAVTSLLPDGLYPYDKFTPFNFSNPGSNPATWQKVSSVTLADVYSHALEAVDVNNNYVSTKMDSKLERVQSSALNARYFEFDCFGGEDYAVASGNIALDYVTFQNGAISEDAAHTGTRSYKTSNAISSGFNFYLPAGTALKKGKYNLSVWIKAADITKEKLAVNVCGTGVTYVPIDVKKRIGDWYLAEYTFDYNTGCTVRIEGYSQTTSPVYYDDFRFHPTEAVVTSYVYNAWGELSHILNSNNMATEYRYDGMGRLKEIRKETFKYGQVKLSETFYNNAQ
jgi:hypothetical protein